MLPNLICVNNALPAKRPEVVRENPICSMAEDPLFAASQAIVGLDSGNHNLSPRLVLMSFGAQIAQIGFGACLRPTAQNRCARDQKSVQSLQSAHE